jgi:hypothetical protein
MGVHQQLVALLRYMMLAEDNSILESDQRAPNLVQGQQLVHRRARGEVHVVISPFGCDQVLSFRRLQGSNLYLYCPHPYLCVIPSGWTNREFRSVRSQSR